MIDLDKIRRFEKTLEFHNRSPKVAQFWNEVSEMLENFEYYISILEWDKDQAIFKYRNLIDKQIQFNKLIKKTKFQISVLKRLNDKLCP